MYTSTLRPGLLVSCSLRTRGNVSYQKTDLEYANTENAEHKKWETSRTISDKEEWERAKKARSAAGVAIRKVCAQSAFGLLCPESDKDELDAAIKEARKIVETFNDEAGLTRLHFFIMVGRVAADDVEAVKAINSEVRELMTTMETGLKNLDVAAVRKAANDAKQLGQMLTPEAQARVQVAIDLARKAATEINRAGEEGAVEIDNRTIRRIAEQRTSFLDMDDALPMQKPKARARRVDLDQRAE